MTRRNSKKEPETLNAMLHGRDAKSQWFGLSAEWSFGGHKPIYFWECARERKWKAKATTTKTATAERILALYDACRAVLYWAIRKTVNGVFFFPSYFFSSSSFLGSEEFYLCNIAIWPIQKKKKKLAHTFGHTNICCLVHAHTCTHLHTWLSYFVARFCKRRLWVCNAKKM